ncbi:2-oxoacid:acceptor oxidoreductase family protein [Natranaerobius thermophilus]|uniref:2-oxoglutarate ferredoxin oxidoreductase, gamma subunit n=1 Tax=Natranaerobius thermophilus (strain ATCC BAA-1301 / DSM 18059 / JW/NM-WN-LF) TaxID=457570 RepID=B2A311_NATTJ|nr:2-oxoacid:acceptor oxidoreductase family protein [Natranaerobius thermophilus]ACB83623.1 2-oxoglutarate ferredoxin oxidoreductase, gamma subunit [Natranaerobius thermophilus JW/NM-WN-LF]
MDNTTKIALAGEGGQGVQSVADIFAEAANDTEKQALYIPNFGVEQRGGVSVAYVQIAEEQIGSPKFTKGDIVVALSGRAVDRTEKYVGENTIFVYDSSLIDMPEERENEGSGLGQAKKILGIPANDIAKQEFHPRVFNIMVLGAVIELSKVLPPEAVKNAIEKKLQRKFEQNPKLREMNMEAFDRGMELAKESAEEKI